MVNKPIPYKFDYSLSRGSKSIESGIESKPYPYKFSHITGLSHGSYRFRYDRRDIIHIEESSFQYVRFGTDLIKEKTDHVYVSFAEEFIRDKVRTLSNEKYKEFLLSEYMILRKAVDNQLLINKDYLVSIIVRNLEKGNREKLMKKYKCIHKNEEVILELIREMELEKERKDYLLEKMSKFLYRNRDKLLKLIRNLGVERDKEKYYLKSITGELNINKDDLEFINNQRTSLWIENSGLDLMSVENKGFLKENKDRTLELLKLKELDKFENFSLELDTIVDLIKEVNNIEGLTLQRDKKMDKIYDLILEMTTYMDLDKDISNKMHVKIIENLLEVEDSKRLDIINCLKDMDKELDFKTLEDIPIGNIQNLLEDKILDNMTFVEIEKEDKPFTFSKKTIKNISKRIKKVFLEKSNIKEIGEINTVKLLSKTLSEVKKDLKENLLDRKIVNLDIEKEKEESILSLRITKGIDTLLENIKLDKINYLDIEKEIHESLLDKFHSKNISKSKTRSLILNTYKYLEKGIKQYFVDRFNSKDVFKDSSYIQAEKHSLKDIALYEDINLILDSIDDIDIEDIEPYYRKAIPDINKDMERLIEDYTLKWIYEKISNIQLEDYTIKFLFRDILESFIDEKMSKFFLQDIDTSRLEKDIIGEIIKDRLEKLLEKIRNTLVEKEDYETTLDRTSIDDIEKDILEFLEESLRGHLDISLDNEEELVSIESFNEIVKDNNLIDVVTSVLIEIEDKDLELDPSPTREILKNLVKELKKKRILEFTIDEDLPLVRAYREINKSKPDIEVLREQAVVKEKSIELSQKFRDMDKFEEKNLDLYKRFWFLRATDPLDWKIVPYNNYPYENEPVVFDENKDMIPDNWQLEMIDVENKMFKKIDKNPVPFGKDTSNVEMALSIEIMIEMINILILLWSRLFYAFTGYTGTQSVTRLTRTLYEWLTLETSINAMDNKKSKEHYLRAYRWIRWEAEKVSIKAREDMNLNGNFYIDEFIFELIYYMENHHFDTMPLFKVVEVMDEYRALIPTDEPQGDIEFVLDKVKGMRHRILDCREKRNNE